MIIIVIIITLAGTVVTGFMPYPSLHAASVSMTSPFVSWLVCDWGLMFAFHTPAAVTLK